MKDQFNELLNNYIANQELANAVLIIRQNGEIVYRNKWGYSDLNAKKEIEFSNLFRMMSNTKIVVAVAVLKLLEQGKLALDDPIDKYLPQFAEMSVIEDSRFKWNSFMPINILHILTCNPDKAKTVKLQKKVTIKHLLSHCSGIQQGIASAIRMKKEKTEFANLSEAADYYSSLPLDAVPEHVTGYSPLAGYDLLGRIIEIVSRKSLDQYLKEEIFEPLAMNSAHFELDNEEKKEYLVRLYQRKNKQLIDVTNSDADLPVAYGGAKGYISGAGGLICTADDYEKLLYMLANDGTYQGKEILKKETVDLMHSEACPLESDAGMVWGLGVKIRKDALRYKSNTTEGTYGWSGAFGTHGFISPEDDLDVFFATNRSDLNGAGSYVSKKIEELVFEIYGGKSCK